MNSTTINTIKELAKPIVEQEDMFLVDVEVKNAKVQEVWVLADSEKGGVDLDACARVSRELSFILEEKDIFNKAYRLNVSSPGLSRPLSDQRQYPKNEGRTIKVKYKSDEEYLTVEGVLQSVNDSQIEVKPEDDKLVVIPFDNIVETKIVPKI
ncbi:ribosome maturation factor RimP [Rhodohalobacter barkolensis]|uniref:Ribosome maturation factor RimP n=1 Tax=Rhodohalobacter barkolensis TaxID=2053187 RepID=A0A2N0VMC0_9BACT|nr:ribosome maturation factor RimP [Rhodohalobacter barkolensis]PKD45346.1 ribosome maturation factor [Rhodohalobacter barkolensis]